MNSPLAGYEYETASELGPLRSLDKLRLKEMILYDRRGSRFGMRLTAHQNRVAKNGKAFLLYLGASEAEARNFRAAMLFHDQGKIDESYPPGIWTLPDRPTLDEKSQQKRHARLGADMWQEDAATLKIQDHPFTKLRYDLTRYHHERADRNGPEGLDARQQPEYVRVSCIIDAYDGDRIQRPHQLKQRTPAEALRRMAGIDDHKHKYKGAFDDKLLAAYIDFQEQALSIKVL